ncbi:MAG: hypothetical protein HQ517_15060 [SAR324 cluster bacterium]|nr:hypothetical protein [SAR324 cluster bacterium]
MSDTKSISLEQFRKRKIQEATERAYFGKMVWLRCPKCETLEYSEVLSPNGRMHVCGALVEEREIELDLRAELTITNYNLNVLDRLLKNNVRFRLIKIISKSLDKALIALKASEEAYQERLLLAAGMSVPLYTDEIDSLKDSLPIKDTNQLGLLISEFRFEPEKRFKNRKPPTNR